MFAHILALLTICSSKDGCVSSSSGRQRICPISLKVKPAAAPFLSSVHEIRMFRRHFDLNLNVYSSILISAMMSMFLMYSSDLFENGLLAWSHDSQTRSNELSAKVSGIESPWSIGISFLVYFYPLTWSSSPLPIVRWPSGMSELLASQDSLWLTKSLAWS